jgi:predicted MFS family arabinose efflux permease
MRALLRLLRDTYTDLPAATWLLVLAAFVNRAGAMVLPFLQIYLGVRFGCSVEQSGLFVGLFGLGSIAGSLLGGHLSDRLGAVRLQILTLAATCVWFQVLAVVRELWLLGAGLFVLGVLNDAFRPGNITAAMESCPPHLRPKALALNRLALNAGWAIGPAIGGMLAHVDYALLFVVDGGTCGLAALLLWVLRARLPQGGRLDTGGAAGPSPWRDARYLVLSALSTLALLLFLQSIFTQNRHLHDVLHFDEATIGLLLIVNPALIVLFEMPLVQLLRRRSRLLLVAAGVLCVGLGLTLLAVPGAGLPLVLTAIVIVTLGEMLWSPQLGAYLADEAPPGARGSYMGVYAASISVAMVLAPWLGGAVYDRLSPKALWLGCGGVGALLAIGFLALHAGARRPGPAVRS